MVLGPQYLPFCPQPCSQPLGRSCEDIKKARLAFYLRRLSRMSS